MDKAILFGLLSAVGCMVYLGLWTLAFWLDSRALDRDCPVWILGFIALHLVVCAFGWGYQEYSNRQQSTPLAISAEKED